MRVSQIQMDKTHKRIVAGASRLLRKRGIESTSVNDVMKSARLTHGGFYRHFDSKDSLVSAALEDAFDEAVNGMEECFRALGPKKGAERYYERYLSDGHVRHPEAGCPIAALSMDVARSAASAKSAFCAGFGRAVDKLAQAGTGADEENRASAIRRLSMMAGAIMIARATDDNTARAVLAACREA